MRTDVDEQHSMRLPAYVAAALIAVVAIGCGSKRHRAIDSAACQRVINGPQSITAAFSDGATPANVRTARSWLERQGGVSHVQYVTKSAALAQAKSLFKDNPGVMKNLPGNPFPASLKATVAADRNIQPLVAGLRRHDGIGQVTHGGLARELILDWSKRGLHRDAAKALLKSGASSDMYACFEP